MSLQLKRPVRPGQTGLNPPPSISTLGGFFYCRWHGNRYSRKDVKRRTIHRDLAELEIVPQPTVILVEDDQAVRDSIVWMLEQERIHVEAYATPSKLLAMYDSARPGCLVLDLHLPEMNGLELRGRLVEMGCQLPFIIITGHAEVPDATHAMRIGAVDFIEKPLNREVFLNRVWLALDQDARWRREQADHECVQARLDSLTQREHEVLGRVVAGKLTKQIATELGITIKTVEAHRSNITRKMQVDSVVQLVRIVIEHQSPHAAVQVPSIPAEVVL